MTKNLIVYICLALFSAFSGWAQVSHGGQPLALSAMKSDTGSSDSLFVQMPAFDLDEQLRIDSLESIGFRGGYRFAYKFMTDYTPDNSGVHFTTSDGTKVWRLGIYSEGALSISVLFSRYRLPEGASLYLYNEDQTEILGAFNHLNNSDTGILPVAPIQGDRIVIEYQEPDGVLFPGELVVGEVNHGYRDFRISGPQTDQTRFSCIPAVACYQDTTDRYDKIERSVVLLIIDGSVGCSGTLVNNSANDGRPYILTASHCLNEQFTIVNPDYSEIADKIVCYFNYDSPQCSPVESGPTDQTVSSAYYRAVNESTDMALIELKEVPPTDYAVYYAGWNAVDSGPAPYSCIHHPNGVPKRINYAIEAPTITSYKVSVADFAANAHWDIGPWDVGFTYSGSSGSPLIDGNNHVIGGLTGGNVGSPTCSNPGKDYFFSIRKCWDQEADSTLQLKCWLDPVGLESPICDGMDPNGSETDEEEITVSDEVRVAIDRSQKTLQLEFLVPIDQASLALVSLEGRTLRKYAVAEQRSVIKLPNLSPGVYIVKILYNGQLYSQKFFF